MSTSRTSRWRRVIALPFVCVLSTGPAASAQVSRPIAAGLDGVLVPGRTVWITDSAGREEEMRVVGVSGEVVTATAAGGEVRSVRQGDVRRVTVRESDPLWNGALIGAGVAVASGLLLCRASEPWRNCRDDVGPMVRIGAIGAGIGIGIDALIRGRRTVYDAAPAGARIDAAPVIARGTAGLRVAVTF